MTFPPTIFAMGGAHIDRRGRVSGSFVPGASNPGTMAEDVGGGVFNALRTASRRGARAALMSVRGGDAAADSVAKAFSEAGIADLSAVFLDRSTPSYTALLNGDGDVVAALADMGLYDLAFTRQVRRAKVREAVDGADAVFCDANLPAAALQRLMSLARGKPVFAIAISPAKVTRLLGVLGALSCLFLNRREAVALAGAGDAIEMPDLVERLRGFGLARAMITNGQAPVTAYDDDGMLSLMPPPARKVEDVTGAGDALAGAAAVALLHGKPFGEALREGIAAALLAVESRASVPDFSRDGFAAALALVPQPVKMR